MSRTPRQYQLDAVAAVKKLWAQQKRRVVVVGCVGSGKTFIAELLMLPAIAHDWAQVFYCAHTEGLLDQPALRFSDGDLRHAFIKAGRAEDDGAALQFCSAATLVKRSVRPALDSRGQPFKRALIFIDEAHRCKSSTYIEILNKFNSVFEFTYIILLTATPYRLDGRGFDDVADDLVEIVKPAQLVADGVIIEPVYWSQPPEITKEDDADAVMFRPGIVGDIVKTWQQRAEGLPTICRAYSIAHSEQLAERFRAVGVRAAHIDGTMSTAQRRCLLAGLAVGGVASGHPLAIDVLCAGSNIFDEGFDSRATYEMLLPRGDEGVYPELRKFWCGDTPPDYAPLAVLVDAAPTASRGAWMQRQGRVVRSWPGKEVAIVLCHSGNLERHGYLLDHHGFDLTTDAAWSPRLRPSTGVDKLRCPAPVTCPGCLCVDRAGTVTCRHCGAVMVTPRLPDEDVAVELVEKSAATTPIAVSTPGTREAYLRSQYKKMVEASRERVARGQPPYKSTWAAVRFKARFGHWPDGGLDRMIRREMGIRDT